MPGHAKAHPRQAKGYITRTVFENPHSHRKLLGGNTSFEIESPWYVTGPNPAHTQRGRSSEDSTTEGKLTL